MREETIIKLFDSRNLGTVLPPVSSVSGGLMHRMYKVETAERTYAVKYLNPEVMKRPAAMGNFQRAEELERILEAAGIPIVPAMTIGGHKMQELEGEYFYIFHWHSGQITDWNNITFEQCRLAGSIQGRIHAVQPGRKMDKVPELNAVDWKRHIESAEKQGSEIAPLLKENEALLNYARDALNIGRLALPDIECITDGDMDPKNVMWENGCPVVIDLECLDYGNPVSDALRLSLEWAGVSTCALDPDKLEAFFAGYLEEFDSGFRDYGSVLGLAYTWIEWLEYNITRALGCCQDESEREMGVLEVRNTVCRIRHIREMEDRIRLRLLRLPFGIG